MRKRIYTSSQKGSVLTHRTTQPTSHSVNWFCFGCCEFRSLLHFDSLHVLYSALFKLGQPDISVSVWRRRWPIQADSVFPENINTPSNFESFGTLRMLWNLLTQCWVMQVVEQNWTELFVGQVCVTLIYRMIISAAQTGANRWRSLHGSMTFPRASSWAVSQSGRRDRAAFADSSIASGPGRPEHRWKWLGIY